MKLLTNGTTNFCCAVCLESAQDTPIEVTACRHAFHAACLDCCKRQGHGRCPLCRSVIVAELTFRPPPMVWPALENDVSASRYWLPISEREAFASAPFDEPLISLRNWTSAIGRHLIESVTVNVGGTICNYFTSDPARQSQSFFGFFGSSASFRFWRHDTFMIPDSFVNNNVLPSDHGQTFFRTHGSMPTSTVNNVEFTFGEEQRAATVVEEEDGRSTAVVRLPRRKRSANHRNSLRAVQHSRQRASAPARSHARQIGPRRR